MNSRKTFSLSRRSNISSLVDQTPKSSMNNTSYQSSIISNITSVTQRRSRKSLLGTRKVTRESILLFPSDTLFSIHEELKTQKELEVPEPQEKSNEQEVKVTSPVQESPVTTANECDVDVAVKHPDSILHCTVTEFSEDKSSSPLRKRLDVLSSPNDDSFIAHETMIMNDECILTTTLEPQNESILAKTLVFSDESMNSDIVSISNTKSTKPEICKNDEKKENASMFFFKEPDDVQCQQKDNDEDDLPRFITLLDSIIERNSRNIITYTKQIEELQAKIYERNQENEQISNMKRIMIKTCNMESETNKENVEPQESRDFPKSPNTELRLKMSSPIESSQSRQIIQEMKGTIKCLKTPRLSRASRQSTILTPHSMSYSISNQWKKLHE